MEDTKRIRVRREPAKQEPLKCVKYENAVFVVGKPVTILGYVGYWIIYRFEVDDEGGVWVVVTALPYSTATFVAPKRVRIRDLIPLDRQHLIAEMERTREHLAFLDKLCSETDNDDGGISESR